MLDCFRLRLRNDAVGVKYYRTRHCGRGGEAIQKK
jgi:hypothetical protein